MICPARSPNGNTKRSLLCGRAVFGSSAAAAGSLPRIRPRPTAIFNRARRSRYNVPVVVERPPPDVRASRRTAPFRAISKRMTIGTVTLDTCKVKRYTLKVSSNERPVGVGSPACHPEVRDAKPRRDDSHWYDHRGGVDAACPGAPLERRSRSALRSARSCGHRGRRARLQAELHSLLPWQGRPYRARTFVARS